MLGWDNCVQLDVCFAIFQIVTDFVFIIRTPLLFTQFLQIWYQNKPEMCLLLLIYFDLHNIKNFLKYLDFYKWQGTFFEEFICNYRIKSNGIESNWIESNWILQCRVIICFKPLQTTIHTKCTNIKTLLPHNILTADNPLEHCKMIILVIFRLLSSGHSSPLIYVIVTDFPSSPIWGSSSTLPRL